MDKKLVDMTVDEYIGTVASDSPAPGGGSASALCGAQGAGLVTMVAGLTVGKKKYADREEASKAVIRGGMPIVDGLKGQIDRDTEAFELVSNAFKLPKESEEDKKARSAAIQAGTLTATEVPFDTMKMALEALRNARGLLDGFNTSAASDLGVAALELLACVKGAWLNVLINIGSLKDRAKAEDFRARGLEILAEAQTLSDEIYDNAMRFILE